MYDTSCQSRSRPWDSSDKVRFGFVRFPVVNCQYARGQLLGSARADNCARSRHPRLRPTEAREKICIIGPRAAITEWCVWLHARSLGAARTARSRRRCGKPSPALAPAPPAPCPRFCLSNGALRNNAYFVSAPPASATLLRENCRGRFHAPAPLPAAVLPLSHSHSLRMLFCAVFWFSFYFGCVSLFSLLSDSFVFLFLFCLRSRRRSRLSCGSQRFHRGSGPDRADGSRVAFY